MLVLTHDNLKDHRLEIRGEGHPTIVLFTDELSYAALADYLTLNPTHDLKDTFAEGVTFHVTARRA